MVKYEKHILVGTYSRNEDLHCSHRSLLDVPEKSPSIRVPSSWSKCNSTNFLNIEASMAAMSTFVPTNDMPRMFSSTSCQFENNDKKIIGHSFPSTSLQQKIKNKVRFNISNLIFVQAKNLKNIQCNMALILFTYCTLNIVVVFLFIMLCPCQCLVSHSLVIIVFHSFLKNLIT